MSRTPALPPLSSPPAKRWLFDYLVHSRNHALVHKEWLAHDPEVAFLGHCLSLLGSSHSQILQDLYVLYKCGLKEGGFFVEFGATDGMVRSNTLLLERELGWSGVLAEPFPVWHEALRRNRTSAIDTRCVWKTSGETREFLGSHSQELATIAAFAHDDQHAAERTANADRLLLPTVSLNDLLKEHGAPSNIDYISIDTEGSELDILSAFDFDQYTVDVFTVEHNFHPQRRAAIHELMVSRGYQRELEQFSSFDDWYVRLR